MADHLLEGSGEGAPTTLQARLDAGVVPTALPFVDATAAWVGTWLCRDEGIVGTYHVRHEAVVFGIPIGPEWVVEPGSVPRPANVLAEVVMGDDAVESAAGADALAAFQDCRAPSGAWVTTGFFAWLEMHEPGLTLEAPHGWLAVPMTRDDRGVTWEVVFHWWEADRQRHATWAVRPGTPGCEPRNEAAVEAVETTAAIPMRSVADFGPDTPRPSRRPSAHPDASARALLYVLGERRELEVLAQWTSYWERVRPYTPGDWRSRRAEADHRHPVEHGFNLGEDAYTMRWMVDPASGEVEPGDRTTRLLRAAHPLRRPGFASERTTLDPASIDRAVQAGSSALRRCYERERTANADFRGFVVRWGVQWDGHAFGVEVSADERLSRQFNACVVETIEALEFEEFAGPAVVASTAVQFDGTR